MKLHNQKKVKLKEIIRILCTYCIFIIIIRTLKIQHLSMAISLISVPLLIIIPYLT